MIYNPNFLNQSLDYLEVMMNYLSAQPNQVLLSDDEENSDITP